MKESDAKQIEGLNLLELKALKELLHLENYVGKDAEEYLIKVKEEIDKKIPYPDATDEELQNLHFRMTRLAEEGHDFLEPMQNIEGELIRRKETGIVYQRTGDEVI